MEDERSSARTINAAAITPVGCFFPMMLYSMMGLKAAKARYPLLPGTTERLRKYAHIRNMRNIFRFFVAAAWK
ncbi:MAG: hypothetical protein PVJ36_08965 [Nitrospirota bacterium]